VIATDPGTGIYRIRNNTPFHWKNPWVEIERVTGIRAVQKYPDRTLLTIWPDIDSWAFKTLKKYKGDIVVYGGENRGCTADNNFHDYLESNFQNVATIDIPQFAGVHDALEVWKRQ